MKGFPEVPVIGNGDVKSPQDAKRLIEVTGCHGVMIGRGALGQPWIFRDTSYYLATGQLPPPLSRVQKAQFVLEHFTLLEQMRGEKIALDVIRKRLSWYSAALQPWPGLRRAKETIQSAQQFRDFMANGIEQIRNQDGGPSVRDIRQPAHVRDAPSPQQVSAPI